MANPTSSGPSRGTENRGTTGGTMGNMQNAVGTVAENVRETARGMGEKASGVVDRARDVASNAADTARDWASGAVDTGRDVVNKAGDYVQEAWESGSQYLHDHSFRDMADDVAGVIRRNPIPALLVGIGLGFILGRSMRSYS